MKMFLISDNDDTLTGMRLAGINGKVAHNKEEVRSCLEEAGKDKGIAILVVTEKVASIAPEEIKFLKLNKKLPLVAVIPDRHGSVRSKDFITQYVREAVGIKI